MTEGITGTGVALVTPFNASKDVDYNALQKMVDHVIHGGVEYIVVLGTTGESATLSKDEKKEVVRAVIQSVNKRIPVVIGCGGNNTSSLRREIKSADLEGGAAILSVAPYYNKPTQRGLFEHFSAIAGESPLPVILYNVPGRTACNMSSDTTLRLAQKFENIIGIKEASGNMVQIMEILKSKPSGFEVVSGDDALTLPMIYMGAKGVISVVANSHPRQYSDMVRAALDNKYVLANAIHYKLLDFLGALFEEGNPAGLKATLQILGLCSDEVRLPLVSASDALQRKIENLLKNIQ